MANRIYKVIQDNYGANCYNALKLNCNITTLPFNVWRDVVRLSCYSTDFSDGSSQYTFMNVDQMNKAKQILNGALFIETNE